MKDLFKGMYYKHQKGKHTVSVITGISVNNFAFIQVIANNVSYFFKYETTECEFGEITKIGKNVFSKDGIRIDIENNGVSIKGEIKYTDLTPIRYDIMGPFKFVPMECTHKIASLHHRLEGNLEMNGEIIDFSGGIGYIEGDSGKSFPKSYIWIQSNDFSEKACITVSTADIPFAGFHFRGCICIVYINGIEYRLATYLGVKILVCNENNIVLKQGKLRLEIEIGEGKDHKLIAPVNGKMVKDIYERIICRAKFRFLKNGKVLFEQSSENASFELVE